jgi:cobalt-zinc-cadmium efflux system membrane fusion protein
MAARVVSQPGHPVRETEPYRPGVARRLLGGAATVVVIAALAAVAYFGHATGWRFGKQKPTLVETDAARDGSGVATVRVGREVRDAAQLPPALRRELAVEFDSAEAVEKAGIDITPAWRSAVTESVGASGEVLFDPTRVTRVSARASGTAWQVFKAAGDPVQVGDVLALVNSAEVGKAKAEFQQALATARLKQKAVDNLGAAGTGVAEQRRREAEAASKDAEVRLLAAGQALSNLGLPVKVADYRALPLDEVVKRMRLLGVPSQTTGIDTQAATANLLPVRSTLGGVVLTANLVAGEAAESGKVLFVVVDPSRLWLTLHVGAEDASRVAVGQAVHFRPDGSAREVSGTLTWMGTSADETSRTVPVRVELENKDGQLRSGSLGRGRIVLREERQALVIPADAAQSLDGSAVVFVRDPNFLKQSGRKAFTLRAVQTGARDGGNVEVTRGLAAGEVVATRGSGLLLSEIKRHLTNEAGR